MLFVSAFWSPRGEARQGASSLSQTGDILWELAQDGHLPSAACAEEPSALCAMQITTLAKSLSKRN